jgi:hypothetical protein
LLGTSNARFWRAQDIVKLYLACLFTVLLSGQYVFADPIGIQRIAHLYSNTESTSAVSVPGANSVLIDDVLVPVARNPSNLPLAITSVTVVVNGTPGDTGALSLWLYPVQRQDGSPGFARTLIGTTIVSYDGAFHPVTFGNRSNPLLTVVPNFAAAPGFGLFFLGLSSGEHGAGWLWADGPDVNQPTAYAHNLDVNRIIRFSSSGPPFPSHISYSLDVQGTPVPEPATSSLIAIGLLVGASCRRRSRRDKTSRG